MAMEVGEFLNDAGKEILTCSLTGPQCYMLNGTGSIKFTSPINFITANQFMLAHGIIESNSIESFLRRQTSSLANMTFANFTSSDWATTVNITSQSSATGNFTSARDEFCIEAKDVSQYKIYCLNNSGGIIGSENVNNTIGDIWAKGCMKSGKGLDFNYEGDVLVACDQGGYGYLFNFSSYENRKI